MLPNGLQLRKSDLQKALAGLSGAVEIVQAKDRQTSDSDMVIEFSRSTRIKKASLRLQIWEQFRDIESEPALYAFSYVVTSDNDVNAESPIFRYECHPDVGDICNTEQDDEALTFQNPYQAIPHFHPDNTAVGKIQRLHFPFHREERKSIIFALINWLQVDLIKRFYDGNSPNLRIAQGS